MDKELLFKLVLDCKKSLDKMDFNEDDSIFFILNYIYGDTGLSEYYELYSLLRLYESYAIDSLCNNVSSGNSIIYFIKDINSNNIKIGCSTNFEKRLKQLSTRFETKFEVLSILKIQNEKMYQVENYFHRYFRKYRVKNEIFDIPGNIIQPILTLIDLGKDFKEVRNYMEQNKVVAE